MTERYCEGERFADLSFAGEVFESCDFADCVFCLLYTSDAADE